MPINGIADSVKQYAVCSVRDNTNIWRLSVLGFGLYTAQAICKANRRAGKMLSLNRLILLAGLRRISTSQQHHG
ncbi:hypothetical protein BHC57_12220 [Snodgrassella alvi]|uniref:Uncharacterized protein n=1 Tax=Snodgrassella alvi TaxID=1196083 RepID=A0A855FIW7_9NEIS|nr:hypothetical protein BHC57_12220 [Snodgrassella alvi]